MKDIFLENEHKPSGSFPYIEFSNKNLNYLFHYHEEIEIAYVESGRICGFSASDEINLSEGDICIFMPGEIHNFISTEDNNLYIIKINANSYIENINFGSIRLASNKISPSHKDYDVFFEIIKNIHSEYTKKEAGYEFKIRSLKNNFLAHLIRNTEYKTIAPDKNIYLLTEINKFIETNYSDKIILEDVAERFHMSKYYFSHTFKNLTGKSFISYLTLFRVEKATVLLTYSDKSMSDIAFECGFGNIRSFNRMFKETLNITPLKYKKLHNPGVDEK